MPGAAHGCITLLGGSDILIEQFRGALFFGASQIGLGEKGIPFSLGGFNLGRSRTVREFVELRGGAVMPGAEFSGVEFDDELARLEGVAFLRVKSDDPSSITRGDVDFVGFNRAGNAA